MPTTSNPIASLLLAFLLIGSATATFAQSQFRIGERVTYTVSLDKFKDAARELGADEDEKRWEERLRKVAKQKVEDRK